MVSTKAAQEAALRAPSYVYVNAYSRESPDASSLRLHRLLTLFRRLTGNRQRQLSAIDCRLINWLTPCLPRSGKCAHVGLPCLSCIELFTVFGARVTARKLLSAAIRADAPVPAGEYWGTGRQPAIWQTGVSMNSKRSYLDTLNAGRQRRPYTSLEQLNRSLETLEQRIGRNREEAAAIIRAATASSRAEPALRASASSARARSRPRAPAPRHAPDDQPYQSLARDIERVRGQEDGVAAVGKIAGELKGLREELRHQMTSGLRREFDAPAQGHRTQPTPPARGHGRQASSAWSSSGFRAPSSRSPRRATTRASTCCGSRSSR